MHSGISSPGVHSQRPHTPDRTARTPHAPASDSPMLVAADGRHATALRQAVGLAGARDPVPNLGVVDADDAALLVVPDQTVLDDLHDRLRAVNRDYLDCDALAGYADAASRLRARLPRAWHTGTYAFPE